MSRHRETNPHFQPQPPHGTNIRTQPPPPRRRENQRRPLPPYSPTPHFPILELPHHQQPHHHPQSTQMPHDDEPHHHPQYTPTSHFPSHHPPQPMATGGIHPPPIRPEKNFPVEHHPEHPPLPPHRHQPHHPQPPPTAITHTPPTRPGRKHHTAKHHQEPSPQQPSSLRVPPPHKTRPHTWLIGAFCALFWLAVILGGLIILVVYIVFRPRSPKFDIANTSLNAAYLDMGYLLNADMTILANFSNPSKKATVDFSHIELYLYYENTLIATSYVKPFSALKADSRFRDIHLVSSQVPLPLRQRERLRQQMNNNRVRFEVKALLHTRSNLGTIFRYSYRLYGHCLIEVTGPPSGFLIAKQCKTKR